MTAHLNWLLPLKSDLFSVLQQNSFPHGLLITGQQGTGKRELALWLQRLLLCNQPDVANQSPCNQCKSCHLLLNANHPDARDIELVTQSISVDQIRQATQFLEKTPQLSHSQVVIIESADKLTESAANALLKTLEEPTANSYIILLAKDEQHLLPTIVSRCRVLQIRPPIGDELVAATGGASHNPFVNITHLSRITHVSETDSYQDLVTQVIAFIINPTSSYLLTAMLLELGENALPWLENVFCDLYRYQAGWRDVSINEQQNFANDQLSSTVEANSDAIYRIYLLIQSYQQKNKTLVQYNNEFGLEQLVVKMTNLMAREEL